MIDTHSHISDSVYDSDRDEVLARAIEAGVTHILCPAVDSENHAAMISLCRERPDMCLPMMGLHPTSVNDNPDWEQEMSIVEKYLAEPPVERFCAIGETGLDLHWSRDFLTQQTAAFERQIDLALHYNLPLVLHIREAWAEATAVLQKYTGRGLRGVAHAFSGGLSEYHFLRSVGDFALGLGGPVTYKKNLWRELLPSIDPTHIVLETDAPWLPPEPFRGHRNESAHLTYILAAAANILNIPPSEVDRITTSNAMRIFGISQKR
jgi:TatD DNase family protein